MRISGLEFRRVLFRSMVDEKGIEPHVPVWDKTQRQDGTLSSTDFQWDEYANEYRCPEGHSLRIERRPFKKARTHITKLNPLLQLDRKRTRPTSRPKRASRMRSSACKKRRSSWRRPNT